MSIEDIVNVGGQSSDESGMWVGLGCIRCGEPTTNGSWCDEHHPSRKPTVDPELLDEIREAVATIERLSRERCLRCGRPLVDGIERTTGICHRCRDTLLGAFDD